MPSPNLVMPKQPPLSSLTIPSVDGSSDTGRPRRRASNMIRAAALKANQRAIQAAMNARKKPAATAGAGTATGLDGPLPKIGDPFDVARFNRIKASIPVIQRAIETTEKMYKEHTTVRRMTPRGIFIGEDITSLIVDHENTTNYVDKAHQELNRVRAHGVVAQQNRNAVAQNIREQMQAEIEATRALQNRHKAMHQARPKFVRHFYSVFGNVLNVTALNDSAFASFNSANMLEIWALETSAESGAEESSIKKLIDLDCDPICLVQHLYSGDMNKLNDPATASDSAPQSRRESTTGGVSSAGGPGLADLTASLLSASNGGTSARNSTTATPSTAPHGARRSNIATAATDTTQTNVGKSRRESYDLHTASTPSSSGAATAAQRQPDIVHPVRRVPRLAELRPATDFTNIKDIEKLLSPEDLELFMENMGVVRHHAVFFIGCNYTINTLCKRKISYIPIRHVLHFHTDDGLPLLMAEICTITGEHILQAFKMSLDIEWACKCDLLRLTAIDHVPRVVPQDRMELVGKPLNDFRHVEELMITSLCVDERFPGIVVALRSGVLMRVIYDREVFMSGERRDSTPGARRGSLFPSDVMPTQSVTPTFWLADIGDTTGSKTLKIAWILDMFTSMPDEHMPTGMNVPQPSQLAPGSALSTAPGTPSTPSTAASLLAPASPAAANLSSISELPDDDPVTPVATPSPHSQRARHDTRHGTSRPEGFEVLAMRFLVSHRTNKPQLLVVGNDGIVRVYPDEMGKSNLVLRAISQVYVDPSQAPAAATARGRAAAAGVGVAAHSRPNPPATPAPVTGTGRRSSDSKLEKRSSFNTNLNASLGGDLAKLDQSMGGSPALEASLSASSAAWSTLSDNAPVAPTVPHIDTMLWGKDFQLLVAFTSKSMLTVYDINDPSRTHFELKVLTKRHGIVQDGSEPEPSNLVRGVQIFDEELGLGIIYHGREWSVFSLADYMEWLRPKPEELEARRVAEQEAKQARSRKGDSEHLKESHSRGSSHSPQRHLML
ncbi:hypothetical protein BC831DRAFT_451349 [Entophlyctis helioformis]|nr:hypothetical protein BC831DRAFT_451349 [Entophlyctis helioformis]